MNKLYASPLRVYLIIAMLASIGIWAGTKLPVSLFPNSNQPKFNVNYDLGSLTIEEFQRLHGNNLIASLQGIKTSLVEVERVEVSTWRTYFTAFVVCSWGSDPDAAKREIEIILNSAAASMPEEIKNSGGVWAEGSESTMYTVAFSSDKRTMNELDQYLEPLLVPEMRRLIDVGSSELHNPSRREVRIELKPEALAQLNVTTREIEESIREAMGSRSGGVISTENSSLMIQMPRSVYNLEDMNQLLLPLRNGRTVTLGELAFVHHDLARTFRRSFKIDGHSMIMLIVNPKAGANLKRMGDQARKVLERVQRSLPPDIHVQVIVDPSDFITSAVLNVLKEVIIGSAMASFILFIFIGSLRNVVTAAIEIPISIALAFIMMWFFHMNMNLLSLAGLALAAGMNVDASVVVMENIFRHFEDKPANLSFQEKLQTIGGAVDEVKVPVIASTLASLVVFVPFMFIDGLSYAILGDLAKAVIFSHGFSAAVALVLVPTVRLHLMRGQKTLQVKASLADRPLHALENVYRNLLEFLLRRPLLNLGILSVLLLCLGGIAVYMASQLSREIVGKPESDWMNIQISVEGLTKFEQMDGFVANFYHQIQQKFPDYHDKVKMTFSMINDRSFAEVLLKVKKKSDIDEMHGRLEKAFPNANGESYEIGEWNLSEFKLPDVANLKVAIHGATTEDRLVAARDLKQSLESLRILRDIDSKPNLEHQTYLRLKMNTMQQALLAEQGLRWDASSLSDALRIATSGKGLGVMQIDGDNTAINMTFADDTIRSIEDIEAFPLNIGGRILPLKVLAQVEELPLHDKLYSENGREMLLLTGTLPRDKQDQSQHFQDILDKEVRRWERERLPELKLKPMAVNILEPNRDLSEGMRQLQWAFTGSIVLIFIAMLLQFGSFFESILVLMAVPLGLLGAIFSLYLFKSTLSVNAVLGMILLNGIAVNNSIILVDFVRRLFAEGLTPSEAIFQATRKRLRPILITTLTTILAMLPIASGYGEGGRVLQPLGIAVVGGLWLSTLLTLVLVPLLHSILLNWQWRRKQ